ncbi:SDR family NAD(P)-dependent oxidoreductase [Paenirhodobacter sp.]|uniref:SDR family NAD(P)-dependent oxidoreductase n=1 Tax=Paenirhodobacter sp. TaxID=1965326 RepID=UPI003B4080A4
MTSTRVALISGANRGIGAAVARKLFADGWAVSLGMRRPELPNWADPERVHCFAYDALDPAAPAGWVAEATARFGRIDALVANAGISIPKSVVEIGDDEFDQLLDVNVKAPRRLAAAAWERLCETGRGRVIILASLSGKRVKSARSGAYSVSKFAALALAHGLRHAGFEKGVRATAVCPGFVATDMAAALTERPAELMTSPHDLARVIALLIDLPNEASVAEFCVNCQLEESF